MTSRHLIITLMCAIALSASAADRIMERSYRQLPLGSIKPEGWLKEQLVRQKKGLTGHLDEIYPQVMGRRNGWLGGDGDMWERGPYWIDGLIPLAYALDDDTLKAKAKPWIEWTLASQQPDGYFGPSKDYPPEPGLQRNNSRDWWPKMVMLKVLMQHYDATGDKRVLPFMSRYFRYQLKNLPATPLGHWTFWGERRGADNLMAVIWLYDKTKEPFLLELAELLKEQTHRWDKIFENPVQLMPSSQIHCVNLGQGFKQPAEIYMVDGDKSHLEALDKGVEAIRHTIGLPTGLWAGDELLRFGAPTQGSELCTSVEMLLSLEEILQITGNPKWGDYIERVAYNALPTQTTDDYSARQYFQQFNQVDITRQRRQFSTSHRDTDLVFGVLSGYPCCTSNMHQGWPKLNNNLWYSTSDGGLAALVYAPCRVSATVAGNVKVNISENTSYPFGNTVEMTVSYPSRKHKAAVFPIELRIPGWCKGATVKINGEIWKEGLDGSRTVAVDREWKQGDKLTLEMPMEVEVEKWYDNGGVVTRGPLLYALKLNEKWEKKAFEEGNSLYGSFYWEVTTDSPWNYALNAGKLKAADFEVDERTLTSAYPWNQEGNPLTIRTKGRRMPGWKLVDGSCGPVSYFDQMKGDTAPEEETIELIPYGCTTLRIAEFPLR